MRLESYSSPLEFKSHVYSFLSENEAKNCLVLGIIETLISTPDVYPVYYLWAVIEDKKIVGVAWMTPPHALGLTEMPMPALHLLQDEVLRLPQKISGVLGPVPQSDILMQNLVRDAKKVLVSTMNQRIYQLNRITEPKLAHGFMRVVNEADQKLLETWNVSFQRDCGMVPDIHAAVENAKRSIALKNRYLWIVDNVPVSMAGAMGRTAFGIRIGYVFTPPDFRGKGYASNLVATLSQKQLSAGRKFCFLYTDLANPISNGIYQMIGYEAVCDSAHHVFESI